MYYRYKGSMVVGERERERDKIFYYKIKTHVKYCDRVSHGVGIMRRGEKNEK